HRRRVRRRRQLDRLRLRDRHGGRRGLAVSSAYRRLTTAETAALLRLARMRDRRLRASVDLEFGRAEAAVARAMRAALDPAAPLYAEHSAQLAAIEADGLRRVASAPASR